MNTIGIVGHEKAKFTVESEAEARRLIRELLEPFDRCVSGGCHLGGIDIWAIDEAEKLGKEIDEFWPIYRRWDPDGYKDRNMRIAEASDEVVCIVVRSYPVGYSGLRFRVCYHCGTDSHIKSGGCWTVKYAKSIGKKTRIIEI